MSDGYFFTFRPTEGVFEEAIKSHRIWRKRSDMSRRIEIDGKYYRVVRTIGLVRKLWVEKTVVCDEEGRIVEDEDITRRCFRVFLYLGYYQFNQEGIKNNGLYKEDGGREYRESLVDLFQTMWNGIDHLLESSERELMAYHLEVMQEMNRLDEEIADASKQVSAVIEKIEQVTDDTYPPDLIEQYADIIPRRFRLKMDYEALIAEARLKGGEKVRKIILKDEYFDYLTNLGTQEKLRIPKDITKMVSDSRGFAIEAKEERKEEKKWLDDVSGPFTLEKYIYELRHIASFERAMRMNMISTMHDHWLLSPHCKFK